MSAVDRTLWEEIVGERTSLPPASAEEDADVITFTEQEIDRTCPAGEEGRFGSDARPIRDFGQPTGGITLPRMPVQGSRDPMRITPVERAAAARWDARRGSWGPAPGAAS
ncbi:hypothetical protein [Streptomyces sp. 378]|uniref:hypothetical protein n=1 Tax=Streptomyces sp. 378 TaxID=3049412 RepID=UPI0024C326F6|nr:hypothetical protein [Streptomyces sp. 378]